MSGVRAGVKVNTVSGSLTLADVIGEVDANTVSGELDATSSTVTSRATRSPAR